MLLYPPVLALLLVSGVVALATSASAGFAYRVLRDWDLESGHETQLRMERRTYLVSTGLGLALGAQVLSLLLFVYTAEALSSQITGAMCATGTLNANAFGFPALGLKLALFFGAALWLLLDRLDRQGHDYPLVRPKYALLLALAPLALADAALQALYFAGLDPEVITSCCGSLFSAGGGGVASEVAGLPPRPTLVAFYATGAGVLGAGALYLRTGHGARALAGLAALALLVALAGITSFLSLYVYESPHHHCPFCLLKGEYDHVGYLLYVPLLAGTVCAFGTGFAAPLAAHPSLATAAPAQARGCARSVLVLLAAFYGVATWLLGRSHLVLLQ